MAKTKYIKAAEFFHEHAGATGKFLNGAVNFLDNILGNIGKLLSTAIIVFTATLIWSGFWGQVHNVRSIPLDKIAAMTPQEQLVYFEERRNAYKGAMESASAPLATLVGTVVTVIGASMAFQKIKGMKTNQEEVAVNTNPTVIVGPMGPSPTNPIISEVITKEDGNKTTITY